MGFRLTAIEIAAIGAAGLAVLVVLVFIIYTFRRRRSTTTRKKSPKPSPNRTNVTPRPWGLGWTSSPSPSPPFSGYPPVGESPSTGSSTPGGSPGSGQTKSPASGSTTLVTPTSSSKLKKGAASPLSSKKSPFRLKPRAKTRTPPKGKQGTKGPKVVPVARPGPAPSIHRPESEEMVMVTYEQGLADMGMVRPHHILRYSEPPPFDQARQAYPVHTPESSGLRSEPPSGNSEVLTGRGGGLGSGSERSRRDRDRARVEPQRTAGRRRGDDGQSTWLPSYYRSPESNRRNLDDEESILGYRAGGAVDGRARYPGWI